jgi:hypothetical protein
MDGPQPEPLYTVTGQSETVDLSADHAYLNGTRVTFRTRSGAYGSVFVPTADYTVERVKALLDARATALEAVHNLVPEG